MADEVVWCVTKETVRIDSTQPAINQYSPHAAGMLKEILEYRLLVPRSVCETDEELLQVIPYIVVKCGDHVMCYQRGKAGEPRLDAKHSIGFGGHINTGDATYIDGAVREGQEELHGFGATCLSPALGFIYDDSNPVGRVHLGVLHVYDFPKAPVAPAEVHPHRWARLETVLDWVSMETWSMTAARMIQESRRGK
jgi:predicted NUDIX family phosphoesterase